MKKGCFLTTVIVLTFSIGIGFYIVKKYGPKFKEYGKEKLFELASDDLEEKIDELQQSAYQDSLKSIVTDYINNLDKEDFDAAMDKASDFFDQVANYIDDKKIDSLEFNILKKIADKNERYQKD